jgi:hypothetical protein
MAKPELKVAIKDVESKQVTSLFAFWRNDNGQLSGRLDGRVKAMKVLLDDDSVVTLRRTDERRTSHFINCYENDGGGGGRTPAPAQRGGPRGGAREFADDAGGFGSDDIPFDRLRGEVQW